MPSPPHENPFAEATTSVPLKLSSPIEPLPPIETPNQTLKLSSMFRGADRGGDVRSDGGDVAEEQRRSIPVGRRWSKPIEDDDVRSIPSPSKMCFSHSDLFSSLNHSDILPHSDAFFCTKQTV
ncbi:hypothetical protein E3N88_37069 [Mikania micrantha]|uniref:Uncharacterized protein n=1 Tax=Mikania micrantha TaxID=192012 RepID=A0A5N6M5J0_9ASTR|nr:hypothetical protein E3N88_37069 [Mikania micrantha]